MCARPRRGRARSVAAALRSVRVGRREPASEPRDRPDEVLSTGKGAPVDLFKSHKQDAHADSRVYAAFTYRMQNEEKWAVNAAGLLGAVCGF
jgi:hypothetical protein